MWLSEKKKIFHIFHMNKKNYKDSLKAKNVKEVIRRVNVSLGKTLVFL